MFGVSRQARRPVAPMVSRAVSAAGLRVHFSGHWHVGGTVARDGLLNISVPSLVAYPAGYQVIDIGDDGTTLQTIRLDDAPGWDVARGVYAREPGGALLADAHDYLDFLDRHLQSLVHNRYLPLEWPPELASLDLPDFPIEEFALDWYRLRKAGSLARDRVPARRIAAYRALADGLAARDFAPESGEAALKAALRLMEACLAAPDLTQQRLEVRLGATSSDRVSLDVPSGATLARAAT
jgi:hypothetical protein